MRKANVGKRTVASYRASFPRERYKRNPSETEKNDHETAARCEIVPNRDCSQEKKRPRLKDQQLRCMTILASAGKSCNKKIRPVVFARPRAGCGEDVPTASSGTACMTIFDAWPFHELCYIFIKCCSILLNCLNFVKISVLQFVNIH